MKKIIILCITLFIIFLVTFTIINKNKDKKTWKVEITNDFINVRTKPSVWEEAMGKVYKGQKFKVFDISLDDDNYIWYKIKLNGRYGWIASSRRTPYVIEFNSPYTTNDNNSVDYEAPILTFYDNVYTTYDINSINYDHLSIKDDSEYTITHIIFFEEHPVDSDIPQYWIQYIVTDKFGNSTRKVQRIIFDIEPDRKDVKDFSELKR